MGIYICLRFAVMYRSELAKVHSEIQGSFPPIRVANKPNIGWNILERNCTTLLYWRPETE